MVGLLLVGPLARCDEGGGGRGGGGGGEVVPMLVERWGGGGTAEKDAAGDGKRKIKDMRRTLARLCTAMSPAWGVCDAV